MNYTGAIEGSELTPAERISRLSDREREVLYEFCHVFNTIEPGQPLYQTIADRLIIAKPTVTTHMGNIVIKLGLDVLHRSQRRVELVQTYCPLILETGVSPETDSGGDGEGEAGEEPEDDEEDGEEEQGDSESEDGGEEPERIPDNVQRIVEELEYEVVPIRVGELVPTEQEKTSRETSSRLPWFLLGIAVAAFLAVGAIALDILPIGGEQQVVVVTATRSSDEAQAAANEAEEGTREVIVEVTSTRAPSEPTAAPVAADEPTAEPTAIAVTDTPAPSPTTRPVEMALPFEDDFNDGVREEWEEIEGTWRMIDGAYGSDEDREWGYSLVGDPGWENYAVEVDHVSRCIAGYASAILVRSTSPGNGLLFRFDCCDMEWVLWQNGRSSTIAHVDDGIPSGDCGFMTWESVDVRVEAKGNVYSAYVNGVLVLQVQDDTMSRGRAGLGTTRSSDRVRFDNFGVTAIE